MCKGIAANDFIQEKFDSWRIWRRWNLTRENTMGVAVPDEELENHPD